MGELCVELCCVVVCCGVVRCGLHGAVCAQGVLYTHRSNYLHALITVAPDMLALGAGGRSAMQKGQQAV